MFTLSRTRKSEDSDESDKDTMIPAGRPYLTKVNGKLVMAREKKPRAADIAIDLLGEAFGTRTIVRRRSRSVECKPVPLLLTGTPFNASQIPGVPYTTPIPQQPSFPTFNPYQQQQHGSTQPFMLYQQLPPWNPSMIPYSQLPTHYAAPQAASQPVKQPEPSREEFDSLKRIDAHFNTVTSKKTEILSLDPAKDINVQEQVTTNSTVTTTKHVCANCGRLRSRTYHAENPIKTGDTPTPAFCRKCQKDSSETGDSDDHKSKILKTKENKPNKNQKKSKSSSDDEDPNSLGTTKQQKPKSKKKKAEVQSSMPEYIIVEEEFSEDERILRGSRPKAKKKSDSSTLGYEVVEEEYSEDDRSPIGGRGRPSLRIEESDVGRRPQQDQYEHQSQKSYKASLLTPRTPAASREDGFGSVTSQQFRRRRVERANHSTVPAAPWDAPHVIRPRSGDETVVVTERYVYKPKKQMEEQRREQEQEYRHPLTKPREDTWKDYHDDWTNDQKLPNIYVTSNEEASRYYNDDWAREDHGYSPSVNERCRGRISVAGRYRRDSIQNSEMADSGSTEYYIAHDTLFHDIPPRAPSPPQSPSAKTWPGIAPLQDDDTARQIKTAKKGKAARRGYPERPSRRESDASEVSSNHRPPFVRQATDGGTEKALIVSPRRNRSRDLSYIDEAASDMTERERIVERETKRVTFRDPSPDSLSSEWSRRSDASESFLKRKTSWDNSAVSPVGGEKW